MLKRYMHERERHFAMLNDNRVVNPFGWGTEFVGGSGSEADPRSFFAEYTNKAIDSSDEFFALPAKASVANLAEDADPGSGSSVSWASSLETASVENNTVRARYFAARSGKGSAVIVLPHWNAKAGTYFDLCRLFARLGISAMRLTLPYHEERMPPELERAEYLVYPNIGRTLQSVRQAVLDTRSCVRWLKERGYQRIGIVGTSIGSCTAFLAFVHDPDINAGVFNHVSGYFSDVVWNGLSTYHVREALEGNVSLDELRQMWLPISPMAYMQKLASQPARPQRYIYTRYDLTFPIDLSIETMAALRRYGIEHSETVLPCGHYTLGEKPWVYIDGFKIVSFLRKHLR
ncbi:MAG: abhydrolase domain-containing 18 [Acidobacteria bacterium]|nr:abhydrolase domain-containing 18 [Acidobacteriota bacterium]MCW5950008.1 hypothetical protein [Pyrinomonadaceae bacterium]